MSAGLKTFPPFNEISSGGFLHSRNEGVMYPPFIDLNVVQELNSNWKIQSNDIFICTHQKVGTHLTKRFIVEILRRAEKNNPESIFKTGDIGHHTVPWPEVIASQEGYQEFNNFIEKTQNQPRLWYTHTKIDQMPTLEIDPAAKFIVVSRDPRAVAVSQYFFYKAHPLLKFPQTMELDEYVELFLEGDLYFGDYFTHVKDWANSKNPLISSSQILVVSYEQMVEEKLAAVKKIIKFIKPNYQFSDDDISEIATSTDFEKMKNEMTNNPQSFHFNPKTFFRAGKTSNWQQHLSPEAAKKIEQKTKQVQFDFPR